MNEFIQFVLCIPLCQIIFLHIVVMMIGLMNDDDFYIRKRTYLLWWIPYVMIIYWVGKGIIHGFRRLK